MIFVKTSISDEPDWVLSAYTVVDKIREIAKRLGVEIYSIVPNHANLPTGFVVSSSRGIETMRIRATSAADVEAAIEAALKA